MGKQRQVTAQIKVQVTGGQATPAPPVGTALGPHGVNIGQFVSQFNEKTRDMMGMTIPVVITVYNDPEKSACCRAPEKSRRGCSWFGQSAEDESWHCDGCPG
jgi:large subunit ribosomal protein L11